MRLTLPKFSAPLLAAIVVLYLMGAGPQTLLGADIYVSNAAGDDLFDGTAPRASAGGAVTGRVGPTATIAKALRIAARGDRIVIENTGRAYHESLSVQTSRHSGYADFPFIVQGNGAVLDGSAPVPPEQWRQVAGDVYRFTPELVATQQLFSEGLPLVMHPSIGGRSAIGELKPREWTLDRGQIYFRTEEGHVPDDYQLTYAKLPVGITLYKVEHVVIADLVVQGFQRDGVALNDSFGPCLLLRLNCRGNGRAGICVQGAARVNVRDTVVGDNGQAQVLMDGRGEANLRHCELIDNTAPKWKIVGGRVFIDGEEPDATPAANAPLEIENPWATGN